MVPSWSDQLLPQLLMEQFDVLPIQYRHIEHMYEGVWFGKFFFLIKWHLWELIRLFFRYKLWYIEISGVNNFVYLILTNVPDCTLSDHLRRFYWKLVFTDSIEIFFKTMVCWFELSLAKTKFFFTDHYCARVSIKSIAYWPFSFNFAFSWCHILNGELW